MAKKFNAKEWLKNSKKTFAVATRLIDGSDYEFEFTILTGDKALAVKRDAFKLHAESQKIVKEEREKDESGTPRDVEATVKLTDIDQRALRLMTRACLSECSDWGDDDLDRLLVVAGGLHSPFGEGVYKACGMSHPKQLLRAAAPDLFEDLPFLSQGKRGRTGGK